MRSRPAKRARLAGRDVATSPPSSEESDVEASRWYSQSKLKAAWEAVIEKYGKDTSDIADEVEIITGKIVVDHGHLRSLSTKESDSIWRDWDSDREDSEDDFTTCNFCENTPCRHMNGKGRSRNGINGKSKKAPKSLKLGEKCYVIVDPEDDMTDHLSSSTTLGSDLSSHEGSLITPRPKLPLSISLRGSYSAGAISNMSSPINLLQELREGNSEEKRKYPNLDIQGLYCDESSFPTYNSESSPLGRIGSRRPINQLSSPPGEPIEKRTQPKMEQSPLLRSSPPTAVTGSRNLWAPADDDPLADKSWHSHHPDGSPVQFRTRPLLKNFHLWNGSLSAKKILFITTSIEERQSLIAPAPSFPTGRSPATPSTSISKPKTFTTSVGESVKRKRSPSPVPITPPKKSEMIEERLSVKENSTNCNIKSPGKTKTARTPTSSIRRNKYNVPSVLKLTPQEIKSIALPPIANFVIPLSTPQPPKSKLHRNKTQSTSCLMKKRPPDPDSSRSSLFLDHIKLPKIKKEEIEGYSSVFLDHNKLKGNSPKINDEEIEGSSSFFLDHDKLNRNSPRIMEEQIEISSSVFLDHNKLKGNSPKIKEEEIKGSSSVFLSHPKSKGNSPKIKEEEIEGSSSASLDHIKSKGSSTRIEKEEIEGSSSILLNYLNTKEKSPQIKKEENERPPFVFLGYIKSKENSPKIKKEENEDFSIFSENLKTPSPPVEKEISADDVLGYDKDSPPFNHDLKEKKPSPSSPSSSPKTTCTRTPARLLPLGDTDSNPRISCKKKLEKIHTSYHPLTKKEGQENSLRCGYLGYKCNRIFCFRCTEDTEVHVNNVTVNDFAL